ncbi:amidase [Pseudoroseomonas cervicalis]|uniref:amidase n=1 Tax=Teichococcus cervicalis TaxID=204525 RepID=UPI0022F16B59|nr:amidase [Pseudoroseomonas cervicalis]WBV45006.1 amidase [Pseudoroseomonas cervicalis]
MSLAQHSLAAGETGALWQADAAELAQRIRQGEISSHEAVRSCLDRMDALNGSLNAVVRRMDAEALAAADAADAARRHGETLPPLHGVPVTIKVNTDQAGHPSDGGIAAYRDHMAHADNPVVANLRRAGAVIIGRTNTPCYSMRWFTENSLHGDTLNPWDARATPGGSSGGAAAAVAAGFGPIAHGNDIAGSVRYPAYCCGVFGLRPGLGRIPSFNPSAKGHASITSQLMAVQGPLTRSLRDQRLAFAAMAMPDPRDPRSLAPQPPAPPRRKRHAALVPHPSGGSTHPAVQDAVRAAGSALAAEGWVVEEIEPPALVEAAELWGRIGGPDTIARLLPLVAQHGDEGIREALGLWAGYWPLRDPAACLEGLTRRMALLREWLLFLQDWPVIVAPVSTEPPFPVAHDRRDTATTAAIMQAQRVMLAVSALGLPGLSVPTGLAEGLPMGVQLIGALHADEALFDAAEPIAAALPMPALPPIA